MGLHTRRRRTFLRPTPLPARPLAATAAPTPRTPTIRIRIHLPVGGLIRDKLHHAAHTSAPTPRGGGQLGQLRRRSQAEREHGEAPLGRVILVSSLLLRASPPIPRLYRPAKHCQHINLIRGGGIRHHSVGCVRGRTSGVTRPLLLSLLVATRRPGPLLFALRRGIPSTERAERAANVQHRPQVQTSLHVDPSGSG